ncbi:MAG TPA: uroporphyrinogen decarboxylase family protein [Planctomycetota bacterium]|nr:uroporphyrinogen decarboxylase family protein [Planctomycetota bacterium]
MTSREIIAALLRREIPERMGIYEHYWGETVPAWQKQGFPETAKVEDYFGYDIQGVGGWFDTGIRPGFQEEVIEETDEWKVRKDGRGATLKYWKAKSGTPEHIAFEVTTPEAWRPFRESLLTLNTKRIDIDAMRTAMKEATPTGRFRVYGHLFIFETMRGTLGDVCMLESFLLEPEWIKDFCRVYTEHYKIHYDYIFREVGLPDGMFIYEDLGFRNGLFCSPRTLAELVIPFYKELVGFFHDHKLPVILHRCGDIRQAVPLIIEAGFDCLQPMEAKAGNDVLEFAKLYGTKLSYMGNIDVTVLNRNDDRLTRAEVEHKVGTLAKMRIPYIFHSDHSLPPDINFGTYKLAVETFRKLGKY